MAYDGVNLSIHFSVCNQLGIQSNTLQCGEDTTLIDDEDFAADVTALFGGQLLKLSVGVYELTPAEKLAHTGWLIGRFDTYDISFVMGSSSNPTLTFGGFIAGLHKTVSVDAVQTFIEDNLVMPDDSEPDIIILGKPLYRA